ncbi:hypothetical protein Droror1_Dr00006266 [Drosera rotundifolia]
MKGTEERTDTLNLSIWMQNEAMSFDEFKSVKHRVRLNKNRERISIYYFVFPEESCLIWDRKCKPFNYKEYGVSEIRICIKSVLVEKGLMVEEMDVCSFCRD